MRAVVRVWFAAFGWLALASAVSAQQASPGPGVRVDGLAAVVGGLTPGPGAETILRSDVVLRARIKWAGQGGPLRPLEPLPETVLHATLQQIIGETLIAREARRVRVASPSDSEVARERQRLQQAAGGAERLSRLVEALGATTQELDAIARQRVRVAAFLKANLEGVTVVTDAEIARFLQREEQDLDAEGPENARQEEQDLDAEDPENMRQRARATLARRALDRAVERWVRVLKDRVPIRTYTSWAEASAP